MPRGLSAAAKAYGGPFLWAVKLTLLDATVRHFATDALTFLGTSYTAYLGRVGDIKQTRSLQADGGEISLLNADLFIGGLLQSKAFEGALCELKQLLLGIEQEILVFKGRLAEQQEGDEEVSFQLVSELDPGQVKLHQRRYAQLCTWQFGRPARLTPCGYNPVAVGDVAESFIGERTADIFSSLTIGDSTLNEAPDAHKDRIVVLKGLRPGDRIVSSGAFLIDSESQLSAALGGLQLPAVAAEGPGEAPGDGEAGTQIEFSITPSPPRVGRNEVTVRLRDSSARPITDAEVTVAFFMPAMPSMGMGAMQERATLSPTTGGEYRGWVNVPERGNWRVTVTARRQGQALASKQLSVVAQ